MTTADIRGRFLWHDLMTTDQGAAGEFYPKVTGWKSEPFEGSSDYSLWVTPSGPAGGTSTLPDDQQSAGTQPYWLVHIGTPDIEGTVEDAKRLGGRVITDITEIPDHGKFAVLADPQGAQFGVYMPYKVNGEAGSGIGEFSWHELATSDQESAWSFYEELFGWSKEGSHDMGPLGTYVLFAQDSGGPQVGGIYTVSSDTPTPPHWLCYVNVPSATEAAEAAKAAGGQVVNGPMEVPGGDWVAQVIDPQGAAFAVHESKAKAKASKAKKPKKSKSAVKADSVEAPEPAAVVEELEVEAEAPEAEEPIAAQKRKKSSKAKSGGAKSKATSAAPKAKGKAAAKASKKKSVAKGSSPPAAAKKAASKKAAPQKQAAVKKKSAAAKKKAAAPKKAAPKKKGSARAPVKSKTKAAAPRAAAKKKKGAAAKKRR